MAYQVSLTLLGGERIPPREICHVQTPKIGQAIMVNVGSRATRAEVKHVSTGAVDKVDAKQL
jgi:hypothetical protein